MPARIIFRNVVINIDSRPKTKVLNFAISGIYALHLETLDEDTKYLFGFFSQPYPIYDSGLINVTGDIIYNGLKMSADDFRYIQNPYKLFDINETVQSALMFVDSRRAPEVLLNFNVGFAAKQIADLTVTESRLFEILLAIVSSPIFIYISSLEFPHDDRVRYFNLLREHVEATGSVCLVDANYTAEYDGLIVFRRGKVHAFDRGETAVYLRDMVMDRFNFPQRSIMFNPAIGNKIGDTQLPPIRITRHRKLKIRHKKHDFGSSVHDTVNSEFGSNCRDLSCKAICPYNGNCYFVRERRHEQIVIGDFDLRPYYSRYKCESLIPIRGKFLSFFGRFFNPGIYKVSLGRTFQICYRKYLLMSNSYFKGKNLFKTFLPYFALIVAIRLWAIMHSRPVKAEFPSSVFGLIIMQMYSSRFRSVLIVIFIFYALSNFIYLKKAYGVLALVFSGRHSLLVNSMSMALIYASFLYGISDVFGEDSSFVVFYSNYIFSPGTYVASAVCYALFSQGLGFVLLCWAFGMKHILVHLLAMLSTCIVLTSVRSSRIRMMYIAAFLSLYVLLPQKALDLKSDWPQNLLIFLYPPLHSRALHFSNPALLYIIVIQCAYFVVSYIFSCFRISRNTI